MTDASRRECPTGIGVRRSAGADRTGDELGLLLLEDGRGQPVRGREGHRQRVDRRPAREAGHHARIRQQGIVAIDYRTMQRAWSRSGLVEWKVEPREPPDRSRLGRGHRHSHQSRVASGRISWLHHAIFRRGRHAARALLRRRPMRQDADAPMGAPDDGPLVPRRPSAWNRAGFLPRDVDLLDDITWRPTSMVSSRARLP